jgi:predicted TIM-barrel fold metal-dependent hydrolase
MRIDVHTHAWSAEYLDRIDAYLPGEPEKRFGTDMCRGLGAGLDDKDLEARFTGVDSADIDLEVLSVGPVTAQFTDRAQSVAAARHSNDDYAEAVAAWPERFRFFASLPLPHIDDALAELDRAMSLAGAVGVTLPTSILGTSPADSSFDPVYAELDRRQCVLFFHPEGAGARSPLVTDSGITWMVGAPLEDTIAAVQLILAGVPTRFPGMKIVLSHLGGALPLLTRRLNDHVPFEAPDVEEPPSVAARRMWYDTVAHDHSPALRCAAETFGADKLVLGTDFPYQSGDQHRRAIRYVADSGLTGGADAAILDENAQSLIGM